MLSRYVASEVSVRDALMQLPGAPWPEEIARLILEYAHCVYGLVRRLRVFADASALVDLLTSEIIAGPLSVMEEGLLCPRVSDILDHPYTVHWCCTTREWVKTERSPSQFPEEGQWMTLDTATSSEGPWATRMTVFDSTTDPSTNGAWFTDAASGSIYLFEEHAKSYKHMHWVLYHVPTSRSLTLRIPMEGDFHLEGVYLRDPNKFQGLILCLNESEIPSSLYWLAFDGQGLNVSSVGVDMSDFNLLSHMSTDACRAELERWSAGLDDHYCLLATYHNKICLVDWSKCSEAVLPLRVNAEFVSTAEYMSVVPASVGASFARMSKQWPNPLPGGPWVVLGGRKETRVYPLHENEMFQKGTYLPVYSSVSSVSSGRCVRVYLPSEVEDVTCATPKWTRDINVL